MVFDELARLSGRSATAVVRISAGTMDPSLLQNMLAGHVAGAYTSATTTQAGLLELARGGMMVLDDVQDLRLEVQPGLLDAVEQQPIWPLGGARPILPEVRWVFGSQRPLSELIAEQQLKPDLAARMGVATLNLLPLSEHREDIADLAPVLLRRNAAREGLPVPLLAPATLNRLTDYAWPCNVRELDATLYLALVTCAAEEGGCITPDHLPEWVRPLVRKGRRPVDPAAMLSALEKEQWVVKRAARRLGIQERTVFRRLKTLGIRRPEPGRGRDEAETA